ncbi:hypothetical protein CK203_109549 [Vitis vinifera]|uniref:Uncharacterized protein n=1 Tax=Vitis vinifera TaxID=29760 RepID=A0A438FKI5_VITVI|nr:hypothetical protein CK203_109549 [Vitis vinifera]
MEGIISFISTTAVRPASPEELTKRIELTPWDLHVLLLGPITRGILFLKPTPGPEENGLQTMTTIIDHLNTSLSCTLDFFYPLADRLGTIIPNLKSNNGLGYQLIDRCDEYTQAGNMMKPIFSCFDHF